MISIQEQSIFDAWKKARSAADKGRLM